MPTPGPRTGATATPASGAAAAGSASAGAVTPQTGAAGTEEEPGSFDGWEQDKDDDGWGDDGGWGEDDGWDDVPVGSPPARSELTTPNTV